MSSSCCGTQPVSSLSVWWLTVGCWYMGLEVWREIPYLPPPPQLDQQPRWSGPAPYLSRGFLPEKYTITRNPRLHRGATCSTLLNPKVEWASGCVGELKERGDLHTMKIAAGLYCSSSGWHCNNVSLHWTAAGLSMAHKTVMAGFLEGLLDFWKGFKAIRRVFLRVDKVGVRQRGIKSTVAETWYTDIGPRLLEHLTIKSQKHC